METPEYSIINIGINPTVIREDGDSVESLGSFNTLDEARDYIEELIGGTNE